MRNLFDQYDQPENKLTHALVCALQEDPKLIRPFLRWLRVRGIPPTQLIHIVQQQIPGVPVSSSDEESRSLPDACFYDDDGWALVVESKVQAGIAIKQLKRHVQTAQRCGYENPQMILISVDRPVETLPNSTLNVEWRQVYEWFHRRATHSEWAKRFVEYMHVFESKMIAQDYQIRGTLTMFDGLYFDEENPYTYNEGKRLIRLLGDELQKNPRLRKLGVDPKGHRRPAITGRGQSEVWDFLPLIVARKAGQHTKFPHLTIGLRLRHATAAITVPNGVGGGFRTKLRVMGRDGFEELISGIEARLRPVVQRTNAKPIIYALQRHFRSQRSPGEVDARLDADLRTFAGDSRGRVKRQPHWVDTIYAVLCDKRSNIQLGIEVQFGYDCKEIRSRKAVGLFAESWIAMSPILRCVLGR